MHTSVLPDDFLHTRTLIDLDQIPAGDDMPLFSLYLNLLPAKSVLDRFERLLDQVAGQKKLADQPVAFQQQWQAEARRIRRWLEEKKPLKGQGIAVFSGQSAGLWRVFSLPVPVLDRLVVDRRPYLRPLKVLLGETGCMLAILAEDGLARLVEISLGQAAEVDRIEAVPVTGGEQVDAEGSHLKAFAQVIADRTEAVWLAYDCDHLVTSARDVLLAAIDEALPVSLRASLVADLDLPPLANLADVQAEIAGLEAEEDKQRESRRVEELLEAAEAGELAVLGLEQSLLAVHRGKVRLLVVEQDFHREGGVCPNDGFLSEGEEGVCLLCGMALRQEPDIVEAALEQVLDQGGEIEVLRSPGQAHALEAYGRIGALLFAGDPASPVETADQQATVNGEAQPKTPRDETVEDSFPASDPPAGW